MPYRLNDQEGYILLITIEGIDGSGKSSLVASLAASLADLAPVMTREPGETWIGNSVRRAIAEEIDPVAEALLFVADHAVHLATVVRPALEKNQLVISDRYTDSRYAYQQVTLEGLVPDPLAWLRQVHTGWTIVPDLTFLLVLPIETALFRCSGRGREGTFRIRLSPFKIPGQLPCTCTGRPLAVYPGGCRKR